MDAQVISGSDDHLLIDIEGGSARVCRDGMSMLGALERAGLSPVRVGCRRGGCGICKVQVLEGSYDTAVMSRRHVSVEEERVGFALACRVYPHGDLRYQAAPQGCTNRVQDTDSRKENEKWQ